MLPRGFWYPSIADALTAAWKDEDRRSPQKWLGALRFMRWKLTEQLWFHRNKILHEEDNFIRRQESRNNMHDIINLFMEIVWLPITMFPVSDRPFYTHRPFFRGNTLHQILSKPLESRKKGLKQATQTMESYRI